MGRELRNIKLGRRAYRVSRGVFVTCLLLTLAGQVTAVEELDPALLASAIETYNAYQEVDLPELSDRDLRALAEGSVVKSRERRRISDSRGKEKDRIRIVGYRIYESPRVLVWLAALGDGTRLSKRLTEHFIEADTRGGKRWYQYLRLPWPMKDRHWVVLSGKDLDLSSATGGFAWEHAWHLDDDGEETALRLLANGEVEGVTAKQGTKAVYVPVNRGGWVMFELDERRVLVAAHVTSVLGGWIPDRLVARFVSAQLDSVLTKLEREASTIHDRYDGSFPIRTGDGAIITPEMAKAAKSDGMDPSVRR